MTATVISIRTRRPMVTEADEPDTWTSPVKPAAPDITAMWGAVFAAGIAFWSSVLTIVCMWGLS